MKTLVGQLTQQMNLVGRLGKLNKPTPGDSGIVKTVPMQALYQTTELQIDEKMLMYQNYSGLYEIKDYIQTATDSNQYIDTGYSLHYKCRIVAEMGNTIGTTFTGFIFGSRDNTTKNAAAVYINPTSLGYRSYWGDYNSINGGNMYTQKLFDTDKVKIELSTNGLCIDGEILYEVESDNKSPTFANTQSCYIGTVNTGGTPSTAYGYGTKIYSFLIFDDDILVRAMLPCTRLSDGADGMIDVANDTFYPIITVEV